MRTTDVAIVDRLDLLPCPRVMRSKPLQALKRALEEARQEAAGELRQSNAAGLRKAMDREYALMLKFIALAALKRKRIQLSK